MLEQLEDICLMSASPLVANPDGVAPDLITVVTGEVINIDVLANDVSPAGPPTIVSFTQGAGGVGLLNADQTFTYTATAAGANAFSYEITDGTNYAIGYVYIDVVPSASDLYATYLAAVAAADEVYAEDVLDAATTRQTDIDAARATAQADAAQLYTDYQFTVAQAVDVYGIAVTAAETAYQNAVASADATHQADTDAALAIYDAAIAASQTAYDAAATAAETAYQADLLAADTVYTAAAQAALDQANQDVANAQAFLDSAEDALNAVIVSATDERTASQAAALDAHQTAQEQANQAHTLAGTTALQAKQDELDAADAAYTASVQPVEDARDQADAAYQASVTAGVALSDVLDAAETALTTAITDATSVRTAAHAAVQSDYDAELINAEQYAAALADAEDAYNASVQPVQDARDQADADYAANQVVTAALLDALNIAEGALTAAVDQACVDLAAAQDAAETAYQAALEDADQTRVSDLATAAQNYQDALTAADDAYTFTVTPYEIARYQANVANQSVRATLADALAGTSPPMVSATVERDQAYANAWRDIEDAVDAAWQVFVTADESAFSAYNAGFDAAEQAWIDSEEIAWNVYMSAKAAADTAVVAAENTDWSLYESLVAGLQAIVNAAETAAQTLFEFLLTSALSTWNGAALTAWNSYVAKAANLPDAPPLGLQRVAPLEIQIPAVEGNAPLMVAARFDLMMLPLILGQPAGPEPVGQEWITRGRLHLGGTLYQLLMQSPRMLLADSPDFANSLRLRMLEGIRRLTETKLPRPPDGWTVRAAGDEYLWGVVPANTLIGVGGAGPCVGVILIPPNAAMPTYAIHFNHYSNPLGQFNALGNLGAFNGYRAVILGNEVQTTDTGRANWAATLLAGVLAELQFRPRGITIVGYVPAPNAAVDANGNVYWTTPAGISTNDYPGGY